MRILVTGGAGFIGSQYVRTLLGDGFGHGEVAVTVLDALTYSGNRANLDPVAGSPGLTFVHGSICDETVVDDVMRNQDAVVHFAAESHVDRSITGAMEFVRTNVEGTQTLLDSARKHGVGRFVHVSTDEVYGSIEEGSWTEYVAAGAALALRGLEGLLGHDGAGRPPHPRHGRGRHALLQQLRPLPVPGESHPAVRHQPARRQEGAALRRWAQHP